MTQASRGPSRATATILHLALMLGPLLLIGIAVVLRRAPGSSFAAAPAIPPATLRLAAGAAAAAMYGVALLLRSRLSPPANGQPEDGWWADNQPRAVVLWALIEGGMLLGSVAYLLSGDLPLLLGISGAGLVLMLAFTPARLAGG